MGVFGGGPDRATALKRRGPYFSHAIRPRRFWRLRRAWHLRVKPVWRSARPFVVISAALAVLVLGTIGFHDALHLNFGDSLYNAIQLFGFGGSVPKSPPWQLQVARFLGPVLVGYAAVRGLLILFREQMQLLWFRLVLRDHIVIAGLGEIGFHLANRFNDIGAQVVVVERDPVNPSIAASRDRGIAALTGSAASRMILSRVQVPRAAYMIVSCGYDATDVEVAMAALAAVEKRRGVLTLFVNLGEPALWRSVKARALTQGGRGSFRLEPFNVLDSAASLMVEETRPFEIPREQEKVLVAADAAISQSLALHSARVWLNSPSSSGGGLQIELLGATAQRERKALIGRHPELEEISSVEATSADIESHELARGAGDASAVFIAYSDEALGLATALALRAGTIRSDVLIVLAVRDENSGAASIASAAGITTFGIFTRALGDEFLDRGMNEVMARANHEEYLRAQRAKGETVHDNRSLVEWDALPESLRQSNRRAVDGIGPKLNEIGAVVTPAPLIRAEQGAQFGFTDDEINRLAILEHERWSRDLRDEGWRHRAGSKDSRRKLHPSLVPWHDLSEQEKAKDRDAVLAIPRVLSRAGYAIERIAATKTPRAVGITPLGQ